MPSSSAEGKVTPPQPSHRLARQAGKIALGLCLPIAFATSGFIDSAIAYSVSYRETTITAVDNSENESDYRYDPNSATVFLNGYGKDISCDQAEAMQPAVGVFGGVFCMTYPSSFNASVSADKIYETVYSDAAKSEARHLTFVTGSMGDKRAYEIGSVIAHKYGVKLDALIMNTGAGPFGTQRIKSNFVRDYIDRVCQATPGKITMGFVQIAIETGEGKPVNGIEDVFAMIGRGLGYNNRVIQDQSCTIQKKLEPTPKTTAPFQNVIYMMPENPENDTIIDTVGAASDWKQIYPELEVLLVGGNVTHDNVSFRPEAFSQIITREFQEARDQRQRIESTPQNKRVR